MHYILNYTFKSHMTKPEVAQLMETFAAVGNSPGATADYLRVDGRGGTMVGETDDLAGVYRNMLSYTEWMEMDLSVVLPTEDAVPQVLDFLGS
jgi:hypothetical protein